MMVCEGSVRGDNAYVINGMNKSLLIALYGIATFIVLAYLIDAQNIRRCWRVGFPSYIYVDIQGDEFIVQNEDEYLLEHETIDSFSGICLYVRPNRTRGPLKEGFTFYYSISIMASQSDVHIYDLGNHSNEDQQRAYQAALLYAKSHPLYAPYNPGEPGKIRYDPSQMFICGFGFASYLGLPPFITWLITWCVLSEQKNSKAYRREHLMCVHCAYSIRGLDSHICPECGQLHGSSTEALA